MAKNEGTLVIKEVRPYDSLDTYPSAYANEVKGGHHQVLTLVERDAIPAARRLEGMFCYVKEDGKVYRLEADLATWIEFAGAILEPVITVSSEYTVNVTDCVILCDASGGGFTVHLPTALSAVDKHYFLKKIDNSWNIVTIDANGSEEIDGELNYLLELEWEFVEIASNGTSWYVVAE